MDQANPHPPLASDGCVSHRSAQGSTAWTLLLVGERGEVRSVSRFKGLAVAVGAGLIAALAAAVLLGVLYAGLFRENKDLRRMLSETRQELSALRGENPILLPHTAALHSAASDAPPPAAGVSAAPPGAGTAAVPANGSSPDPMTAGVDPAPVSGNLDPSSLTIDDFSVRLTDAAQTLAVQFTLKNTGATTSPASGFVTVVLKDDAAAPTAWISIPTVDLRAGRPAGEKKGYAFSIANYKTMQFKAQGVAAPERFQAATVFVYDAHGAALFEMDFPIDFSPRQG